ncbi:MAG: hypothetical protein GKS00_28220 [Alphaproteobacteria bacterium]|nr:hypothetical protein [Alphaproteobacteria bacterium]
MYVGLYDSVTSLPAGGGDRILVFAGHGSLIQADATDMVTEIHCTYRVGDGTVEFLHNGDATTLRFEQALSWAVKYASKHGIDNVYGVFELKRPLDHLYLKRICPDGLTDRRNRTPCRNPAKPSVGGRRGTPSRQMILRRRHITPGTAEHGARP